MSPPRVLLFVMGSWSYTNGALSAALQRQMPGWEVKTIDLLQAFKRDHRSLLSAVLDVPFFAWHSLRSGGLDKNNLLYAPTISKAINRLARRATETFRPAFTLQTTTRFNAATGLVPHFAVIDATAAAARRGYRELYDASPRSLALLDAFQQRIYSASTGVFALGEYVRRSLVRDYRLSPQRAFTIGAGPNIVLGERSKVVGSQNILFVGSDWVRKGGPSVLEAFRAVRRKHPGTVLTIAGTSVPVGEPGVEVLGSVPRDQLHRYFSEARIFVLPSLLEAFGIVFVEALHFGLPVVASTTGAIPEMVREEINGFTVRPGDVDRLAYAFDRLLGCDETALNFGEASHRLSRHFTWERSAGIICDEIFRLSDVEPPAAHLGREGLKSKALP